MKEEGIEIVGENAFSEANKIEYEFVQYKNSEEGRVRVINKEDEKDYSWFKKPGLVSLEGPAQLALDWLAKANGSVAGYKFRSRRIWRRGIEGSKTRYYTAAKSLLPTHANYQGKYLQFVRSLLEEAALIDVGEENVSEYRQAIKEMIQSNLTDEVQLLKVENFLVDIAQVTTRVALEDERTSSVTPAITLDELNAITNFDENGDHPELFLPLDRRSFNALGEDMDANARQLEDLLVSNLEVIFSTRIQVTTYIKE